MYSFHFPRIHKLKNLKIQFKQNKKYFLTNLRMKTLVNRLRQEIQTKKAAGVMATFVKNTFSPYSC